MKIAVINGPNMNLLGIREKKIYGNVSLAVIEEHLKNLANQLMVEVIFFQSNHEGEIVDFIQQNLKSIDGIVINPAGLSKTGYSVLDAMCSINIPYMEVHMSNIYQRGGWHAESIFTEKAAGLIVGLKDAVYDLGLRGIVEYINRMSGKNYEEY